MLIYEKYQEGDLSYIVNLIREQIEPFSSRPFDKQRLMNAIRNKNETLLIYRNNDQEEKKRIGILAYRRSGTSLYIHYLALEKSEQHHGFGQQIFQFLENVAFNKKIKSLILHVARKNKQAINAYHKYGFIISRKTKHYYTMSKKLRK